MSIFCKKLNLLLFLNHYRVVIPYLYAKNEHSSRLIATSFIRQSQKKLEAQPTVRVKKIVTEHGVIEVKKKVVAPKISLLSPDDSMQIITLEEAEKIAKRRGLKLTKTADWESKTGRPTYKLMTAAEYVENLKKEKAAKPGSDKKDEKLLNINARITEHDLQAKIKHILKWLEKEHAVRVIISGESGNLSPAEKIFLSISESVKEAGRIVQKISKGGEIKFQIILPKKPKKKSVEATVGDVESESDSTSVDSEKK